MAPHTYGEILASNIRSARSRIGISQESLAERMRALGFEAWIRQTVGSTDQARRRPTAEEVLALSLALETTIARLMSPLDEDGQVELPSGDTVAGELVQMSAMGALNPGSVTWVNNKPVIGSPDVGSNHLAAAALKSLMRRITEGNA